MINCERCYSSVLRQLENGEYECNACGAIFGATVIAKYTDTLGGLISDMEQKSIANARKNLWTEVNKQYLNNSEIVKWANEILKFLPNDFYANLYKTACVGNIKQLNDFINAIDIVEHYNEIEYTVDFILNAIVEENLLSLNNLIERAYKNKNLEAYEHSTTKLAKRAKEVNEGIYNINLQRDVFVAYKSEDMSLVEAIVGALEESGLSCFVSMRNLQHGRGAVDNYRSALERVIDNCKTLLFVSTEKSRNFSCDAVKYELPYIKHSDLQKNPMYRDSYETMPLKYKKFRVQLVYGALPETKNAADRFVNNIFNGYEYAYSVDEAVDRISQSITSRIIEEIKDSDEQICLNCGTENTKNALKCIKCGAENFCDTIDEYRDHLTEKTNKLLREKAELDKKVEEEKAALLKQIEELKKASEVANATATATSEPNKNATIGIGTTNDDEKIKNPKVDILLDGARNYLEAENYIEAGRECDKIYKIEPDNPELWILRTLIEVKENRLYKVAKLSIDLTKSNNFQKAVRYGKGEEIEKLKKAVSQALRNYNEGARTYTEEPKKWQPIIDTTKKIADIIDDKRKKLEIEIDKRKTEAEAKKRQEEDDRRAKKLEKYSVKNYTKSCWAIIIWGALLMGGQGYMISVLTAHEHYLSSLFPMILAGIVLILTFNWAIAISQKFNKCSKYAAMTKIKTRFAFNTIIMVQQVTTYVIILFSVRLYIPIFSFIL